MVTNGYQIDEGVEMKFNEIENFTTSMNDLAADLDMVSDLVKRWNDHKKRGDEIFGIVVEDLAPQPEPKKADPPPQAAQKKRGPGRPSNKDKEREKFEQKMLNQAKGSEDI